MVNWNEVIRKQGEILEKQTIIIEKQTNFTKILAIATIILALTNVFYCAMFFVFGIFEYLKAPLGGTEKIFWLVEIICIPTILIILMIVLIVNLSKLYPKKKNVKPNRKN